jgi:hypothetical protein
MPICKNCKEEYKRFRLHECKRGVVEVDLGLFDLTELARRRGRSNLQWASAWARALFRWLLYVVAIGLLLLVYILFS